MQGGHTRNVHLRLTVAQIGTIEAAAALEFPNIAANITGQGTKAARLQALRK